MSCSCVTGLLEGGGCGLCGVVGSEEVNYTVAACRPGSSKVCVCAAADKVDHFGSDIVAGIFEFQRAVIIFGSYGAQAFSSKCFDLSLIVIIILIYFNFCNNIKNHTN